MRATGNKEAPVNGLELVDRALTRGECRRSQRHSARRQPTIGSELLQENELHHALHHTANVIPRLLVDMASGQRSTCLQGPARQSQCHTQVHTHPLEVHLRLYVMPLR
jgi:hypothetical protein